MKLLSSFFLTAVICICLSCSFHANNWQSIDSPGENKITFKNFTGKYATKLSASAGDSLFLVSIIELTEGQLNISLKRKKTTIWSRKFQTGSGADSIQIPVTASGEYQVVVKGENAAGKFDLHYTSRSPKTIQVITNKNLELFGLMLQLDMGPDLVASTDSVMIENRKATWRDWYAVGYRNYLQYKQFDSSEIMQTYRKLVERKLYNDFFVGFLEQVDEVPFAKINATTDRESILMFSSSGDFEEAKKQATDFLEQLNHFYTMIDFGKYLEENKAMYAYMKAAVAKNLPDNNFIPVMESFYQKSFTAYCLVPVLNIPTSMGFGKMNKTTQTIYNAFGPFSFQVLNGPKTDPGFDFPDRIAVLSVHEFGHSFVNPAIDNLPKGLIDSTAYLYLPIKEAMSKKSYTNWQMCLYEHFVKAGEILIARKLGTDKNEAAMVQENVNGGFIYLPFLVKELEGFDENSVAEKNYFQFVQRALEHLEAAYPK